MPNIILNDLLIGDFHGVGIYPTSENLIACALIDQGGCTLRPFMPDLMRPIVDALMDGASIGKREVAVATLGKVVESTG
jgi:hypothetical protein